mmetsp:Transcript_17161/g.37603  ORF Transcript_17161/g.37603 Transcript_17161/m.37603 type:complete len:258 (+) Transcript_17161:81-854(+)
MHKSAEFGIKWNEEHAKVLQDAVDKIFSKGVGIDGLEFSFTIADPILAGCPLIGCSTGFGTLCGYQMHEIVGRNCRFLVEPVPADLVNDKVRRISRDFCASIREGRDYIVPEQDREPWMPPDRHSDDGVFCVQTNSRKDGTLFKNMFYMKRVDIGDHPYIIGLQSEFPEHNMAEAANKSCRLLDQNMWEVERTLGRFYWISTAMRRQEDDEKSDGFMDGFQDDFPSGQEGRPLPMQPGTIQGNRGSFWNSFCCLSSS